jgi:hypothetical protein
MLKPIDGYFEQLPEPHRACLQFVRNHINNFDENITEAWKYGMPFFCYGKKMFCYCWLGRYITKIEKRDGGFYPKHRDWNTITNFVQLSALLN